MDIKALIAELAGIRKDGQELLDAAKDRELTGEEKAELAALTTKATELRTKIEDAEDIERKATEFKQTADFLEKPQYKAPRGTFTESGNDRDARKALMDAGWEVKGGFLYGPTSSGRTIEMFPVEVLFGDLPEDDADATKYFKSIRGSFEPDYRAAYMRHFRLSSKMGEAYAWQELTPPERKALSEGSDTAGGFLVPPDAQSEMLQRLAAQAIMRSMAQVVPTSRDLIRWPRVQPNTSSAANGSIYSSGFVGGWVGETPAFVATDPAFGLFEISVKKVRVATKLSNDLINDAAFNVLAWLASNGAENMGLVEDNGFLNGMGAALQPMGLLNAEGIVTVDLEGSTANTISNSTSAIGSASKLIDLEAALPTQYAPRAQFLMHRLTKAKVRKLVDAQNRFLYVPGFGEPESQLLGRPLKLTDFMPQDGTDANKVAVYGDFKYYIIVQRTGLSTTILRERFADTEETGIIMTARVGGGVWNPDAFRIGIV